ncbi:site-specific DNA-methyltransferase [Mesorhizobium sp. M0938]|uniref:DNA-methyltransferase n=1 Tax=unclassified Mesorhizobium TaxID=325217 RepID=UPI00333E135C
MSEPQVFLDGRVSLYIGDCIAMLDAMETDSVDCVVTSPPYWGLRDYGVAGQIGLEPTLGEHLAVMVRVFEAVRRVLKPTGTLWVNYGDCYATTPNGRSAVDTKAAGNDDRTFRDKPFSTISGSLKAKDLCMIPNRLAIALQDAGWWVRSEIVWGKTNPMPDSSGAQRPSTAHEKIFLLTKSADADIWRARDTGEMSFAPDLSERCPLITDESRDGARWMKIGSFYDAEAVRQGRMSDEDAITFRGGSYVGGVPGKRAIIGNKRVKMPDGWDTGEGGHGSRHRRGRENGKMIEVTPRHQGQINHTGLDELGRGSGRLLRNYEPAPVNVWEMATQAYSDAHFATFPAELAERCILAGCPKGGLVLDPFGGAGTTALVALRHHRRAALIELNPTYAEMARARIEAEWRVPQKPTVVDHGPLFSGEVAA